MPRPVSMRASYRDDVGYLLRLEGAVVKDLSQSEGWRKRISNKIRDVSLLLLEAEKNKRNHKTSKLPVAKHR